jgi:hypothetical protein
MCEVCLRRCAVCRVRCWRCLTLHLTLTMCGVSCVVVCRVLWCVGSDTGVPNATPNLNDDVWCMPGAMLGVRTLSLSVTLTLTLTATVTLKPMCSEMGVMVVVRCYMYRSDAIGSAFIVS